MDWFRRWLSHFAALWVERPVSCVLIALLGGAFSFGYSYVPLHSAKHSRIERLEGELAKEAGRGLALAERLAEIELENRLAPAAEDVAALRSGRSDAEQRAARLEAELARADQRISQLERDRSRYRRSAAEHKERVATLERERDALLTARAAPPPPVAKPAPAPVSSYSTPSVNAPPGPAIAGTRPPSVLAVPE